MAERLLTEDEALQKIELNLKLQGKPFSAGCVNCGHCRFDWHNIPGGKPHWKEKLWYWEVPGISSEQAYASGTGLKVPNPKPEKANWYCFNYKKHPSHAYLRFKVIRRNKETGGVVAEYTNYYTSFQPGPLAVYEDTLVLVSSGSKYVAKVCKKFESKGR